MTPAPIASPPADSESAFTSAATRSPVSDNTLSEAWLTIRKRKFVIIAAAVLGIAYGIYQAASQPRLYNSDGEIEIRTGSSNEFRVNNTSLGNSTNSVIPTQVAILKSDTLLLTVAHDLNLANDPDFMGFKTRSTKFVDIDADPRARNSVIAILQGDISVSPLNKTDLIHISCLTLRPQLSADIVNDLIRAYIFRSLNTSAETSKRVSDFLSTSLGDLRQKVEASQGQMIELQKKLGVLGFDPSHNEITANLDELTRAAEQAQLNRIIAEVRYRTLNSMDRSAMDEAVDPIKGTNNPSQLSALRGQLDLARANLAQLSATLGPNHPQVKAVRAQVDELQKVISQEQDRLLTQAKADLAAAQTEEARTNGALESQKTAAYQLRDDLVAYTLAQRDFDSNRTLYESLTQRLRTAGIQAGLESTEIDIVDSAVAAVNPSLRPASTILIIDTTVALVIGLVIAFILDGLDTGLRNVAEIEAISGLPSLALIPRIRREGAAAGPGISTVLRNVRVLSSPKSEFAEAIRALRTSLLLSVAGREPRVILLTSATPAEGKTTVSVNLACVLAQRDVRVLLIDADLRRPTIHHRFGLNGKLGLTSVLTGTATLAQAVQQVAELPNLDILVCGPVPPFPTEMLGSAAMRSLLEEARGLYTHIVMDSPPLLSVTDSVVLARDSDAVVLLVRHGKSGKHAIRRARDLLLRAGAHISGIALNSVDLSSPEYYSYYGYYGYTGYGSSGIDSTSWDPKSGRPEKSGSDSSNQADKS
jgi:succinoglycan biosynthesis transport protein ExoP